MILKNSGTLKNCCKKSEMEGLTLHNRFYSEKELTEFCQTELSIKETTDWKKEVYRFILNFLDTSDFIVQETSGSTGKPKKLQIKKQWMIESAEMTARYFGLKKNDVAVLCLPVKYIAGKMMVVRAMVSEMNLFLTEPNSVPDFSGIPPVDFCAMVPLQAAKLLDKNIWPYIHTLILGGAETSPELEARLKHTNTKVFETYGMAETSSHIALRELNKDKVFTALPGIELLSDKRGCLVIKAPFLPEKITTNDCVKLEGNQFTWQGRADFTINSGGIKIQPETLEKQIQEILNIPCAVTGKKDSALGNKVVLVIESGKEIDRDEILIKLSEQIPKKQLPKEIVFLKKLPRKTSSYKLDRTKLGELIGCGDF